MRMELDPDHSLILMNGWIYHSKILTLVLENPFRQPEKKEWKLQRGTENSEISHVAMNEEFEAIWRNETWEKPAISLKWVFKSMLNPDGTLSRKKAQLVAKGFAQREKIVFKEIFSMVALMETI